MARRRFRLTKGVLVVLMLLIVVWNIQLTVMQLLPTATANWLARMATLDNGNFLLLATTPHAIDVATAVTTVFVVLCHVYLLLRVIWPTRVAVYPSMRLITLVAATAGPDATTSRIAGPLEPAKSGAIGVATPTHVTQRTSAPTTRALLARTLSSYNKSVYSRAMQSTGSHIKLLHAKTSLEGSHRRYLVSGPGLEEGGLSGSGVD